MNYQEIESWIRENIIKSNGFSLDFLSEDKKILGSNYFNEDISFLDGFLKKIGKSIQKDKDIRCVYWFKINYIDNAISDLMGLGKISHLEDLDSVSHLLRYDKAEQSGDIIVGVFDASQKWLIKIVNCQDENKIEVQLFGKGKVIGLLKNI